MEFAFKNSQPIWQQLAAQLRLRIVTGVYPAGERFPSVRELAAEAGVNPNTLQRAVSQLETDELVTTNRTSGRVVTDRKEVLQTMRRKIAQECAEEYFAQMQALGYSKEEAAAIAEEGWKHDNG